MIAEKNKIFIIGIFTITLTLTLAISLNYRITREILLAYNWFTLAITLFISSFFLINYIVKKNRLFSTMSLFFSCIVILEIIFHLTPKEKFGLFKSFAMNQQLVLAYLSAAICLIASQDTIIKTKPKISYSFLMLTLGIISCSFLINEVGLTFFKYNWLPILPLTLLPIAFIRIKRSKYWADYFLQYWFLLFIGILFSAQLLIGLSSILNNNQLLYSADFFKGISYIVILCGIFFQFYKTLGKSELQANNLFLATEEVRQEIEEREWTEELLNESRLFSESIVESINEPLLVLDSELKIIKTNHSFYTLFNLNPKQTLNRFLNEIGKGEWNNQELLSNLKSVINDDVHIKNYETSIKLQHKSKTILLNARRIAQKDIKTNLLILTINDITDLKKAQENARLLARGVESALEAIILTDHNGSINYVNPAYLNLTSFTFTELKGKKLNTLISDLNEIDFKNLLLSNQSENKIWTGEATGYKKNGSAYEVYMTIAPVYDEFQKLEGFVSIQNDITELKKAKEDLAQRATELARSNAELEQFAYVASHDLQEPLRMVSSFCQLLKKRYYDKLDKDANEFIDFAVDGAKRMQTLISDLLLYSRVGTRGKPFAKTDCNDIINKVLKNLQISIEDSDATINIKDLPTTVADETQLVQLFQNIIGNAIKFRNSKSPEISVASKRKNGQWQFSIKDNGIGIAPKYQNKIFTIFQRLENKENYPGTGIGLAVCKKIIERHRGKIWVKSEPGKGCAFYFTLPALEGINQ